MTSSRPIFRRRFRLGKGNEKSQNREEVGFVDEREARLASQVSRHRKDSASQNREEWNSQQENQRLQRLRRRQTGTNISD